VIVVYNLKPIRVLGTVHIFVEGQPVCYKLNFLVTNASSATENKSTVIIFEYKYPEKGLEFFLKKLNFFAHILPSEGFFDI
jgi:hypothetical protein